MYEMIFEEFLVTTKLPSMAKEQLPHVLSDKTKGSLLHRSDAERIIASAIEEINHGAIETLEILINQQLATREKQKW